VPEPLPDPARLLAVRSELGYTDRPDRAMPDEPEAVPASYQRSLTRDAETQRRTRERAAWVDARDSIRDTLASLSGPSFERSRSELRAILRLVERVDKQLAA
jgi:hypothetical protein